jgi:hypothetical protein
MRPKPTAQKIGSADGFLTDVGSVHGQFRTRGIVGATDRRLRGFGSGWLGVAVDDYAQKVHATQPSE